MLGSACLAFLSATTASGYAAKAIQASAAGPGDTAWVDLFNGQDFTGLYVYNYDDGRNVYDSSLAGNALFKPVAGEIRVTSSGGQRGHVATRKDYSHFHMKVDWKIAGGNCGVMYHLREDLALLNPRVRLYDVFPPSIEAQGEKGNGGDCWLISNVWMNTTLAGGRYSPAGQTTTFGGVSVGGRMVAASEHFDRYGTDNPSGWNTLEVIAYGADSVLHIVNGKVNFRGTRIEYTPGDAPTSSSPPKPPHARIPFDHGRLSLQAEMSPVAYRNWKVAELIGCMDVKADNYKSYLAKHRPADCRYSTGLAGQAGRETRQAEGAREVKPEGPETGLGADGKTGRGMPTWRAPGKRRDALGRLPVPASALRPAELSKTPQQPERRKP